MDFPKLRGVEAFPVTVSEHKMIALRDPMSFSNDVIAVPQHLYLALTLLDGRHSLTDIQAEYMRRFGELLYKDILEDLVNKLDAGLFLDNENFHQKRRQIEDDFRKAKARQAALAGKSYSASSPELAGQINGFFTHADGPGLPDPEKKGNTLKGIIAPHIDFIRGGPCFAWGYKEVVEQSDADVFVIFGTAHAPTRLPFAVTHKDFETPFGTLPCNREFVKDIQQRAECDFLEDEFAHRAEHSIEFQTVLLSYLFKNWKRISIVPVLCGSFHEMVGSHARPRDDTRVKGFIDAIRATAASRNGKICYVAGADLAHVGPRFGDRNPISENFLRLLHADDLRMLAHLERADADGFFGNIDSDGDRRKICGLPPIYTMLSVMNAATGKLLKYQQWPDPQGTVTFASMAFY
ncbi:AmmeMemoRadiSam system protein B [Candidatus Poribacteria bacterium]|nr:AmmeMemoRadiSam system protein B [Candidatus Poribacteria bacterium]